MYNYIGQNFINMIRNFYPNLKVASGGREVRVCCPFCVSNGLKEDIHHHLYIGVPQNVDEIAMYDCKRCPAAGRVSGELLTKLGCNDSDVLVNIDRHNADVMKLPKYKYLKNVDIYPLNNNWIDNTNLNLLKLKYINERLGTNYSFQDILNLKIFLDLNKLIQMNNLELTRDPNIVNLFATNFIGFISFDNSFTNMRRVFEKGLPDFINKRYMNYSLIGKQDGSKNFYVIPTQFNYYDNNPVKIHIAEGPFDVLGIYNLNNRINMQNIYIACGGKSYIGALQFILQQTGLVNYEVHLYPDGDVNEKELNKLILNKIRNLPCDIIIHRNKHNGEKDYGVPLDHIEDSYYRIGEAL